MKGLVAKSQHKQTTTKLKTGNPALQRLAESMVATTTTANNYSRMHHRHNRSRSK